MKQDKRFKITVVGCGRWGSLITWYLDRKGHSLTLYGRESSPNMQRFLAERRNDLLELGESVTLSTSYDSLADADKLLVCEISDTEKEEDSEIVFAYEADIED